MSSRAGELESSFVAPSFAELPVDDGGSGGDWALGASVRHPAKPALKGKGSNGRGRGNGGGGGKGSSSGGGSGSFSFPMAAAASTSRDKLLDLAEKTGPRFYVKSSNGARTHARAPMFFSSSFAVSFGLSSWRSRFR
jgi:hypothetical protein